MVNRGRRLRPGTIRPITPGWGRQRLDPSEAQLAVYAFETEIDFEQELVVEYGDVENRDWDRILRKIQAEAVRVRARAKGDGRGPRASTGPSPDPGGANRPLHSRPNFRIFR